MFNHASVSAALNTALSIAALMNFLADKNVDHIVEAGGLACDTVALNVQAIEGISPRSLSFKEVMQHPLVQQELQQQKDDLQFLSTLRSNLDEKAVKRVKERSVHKQHYG